MNIPEEPDKPAEINIVPMIDVIFAILTFFIMATLFLTRSEGLPVNLPQASTSEAQTETEIMVTVNAEGDVFLNRNPIEVNELPAQVRELQGSSEQVLVIVNADELVGHGRVVEIMDALRTVEGARLGIATQKP
jgi:biopolymer transport protein ExbD